MDVSLSMGASKSMGASNGMGTSKSMSASNGIGAVYSRDAINTCQQEQESQQPGSKGRNSIKAIKSWKALAETTKHLDQWQQQLPELHRYRQIG
jgi:hypothetical protein